MGKYSLLVMLLFLLCSTFQRSSCVDIFKIVTSPNSSCDVRSTCYTLQEFATTDTGTFSNSIILELQPGTHYLNSLLMLTRSISYFTMRGNTTDTVIMCSLGSSIHFYFNRQQLVTVRDVSFIDCKMNFVLIMRVTFLRSSFRDMARNSSGAVLDFSISRISVEIEDCTFVRDAGLTNNNLAICFYSGSLHISNSTFRGFTRFHPMADNGGALYISTANVTIASCNFSDNVVGGNGYGGAAVYITVTTGMAIIIISDSCFTNNSASAGIGGAVYVSRGELIIDNSYFCNNRAHGTGGSIYISGGNLSVTSTYFINSTAMANGGAILADSGNLNILNSHFAGNSAGRLGGAAAYCTEAKISIINSTFHSNDAKFNTGGRCGAVCTTSGKGLLIHGSNFTDNSVASTNGQSGGALYINDNNSVSIRDCSFNNNNVTVLGNQNGGAIYVHQGQVIISDSYFIDNNVATGSTNSGTTLYMDCGNMTIICSYFCNENHESDYITGRRLNITITDSYFITNETTSSIDHLPDGILRYQHNSSMIISTTNISTSSNRSTCGLNPTVTAVTTDNDGVSTTITSSIRKETSTTSEPTSKSSLQTNPSTKEVPETTTLVPSMVTTIVSIYTIVTPTAMSMVAACARCLCCGCCGCCGCCCECVCCR